MKYYQKPLVMLTLLALGVQSYADVLQTAVSASHTTPKVINQTENSTTSQSLEINPYGKLSDVNQEQAEVIGIDFDQNPFIYGSGYHDTESNLEYMGARYYSADTGRFMAQDSYDLINRYNYANANPIMYVDPDGHMSKGDIKAAAIGVAIQIIGLVILASITEQPELMLAAEVEPELTGDIPALQEMVGQSEESEIPLEAFTHAQREADIHRGWNSYKFQDQEIRPFEELEPEEQNAVHNLFFSQTAFTGQGPNGFYASRFPGFPELNMNVETSNALYEVVDDNLHTISLTKQVVEHGNENNLYPYAFEYLASLHIEAGEVTKVTGVLKFVRL